MNITTNELNNIESSISNFQSSTIFIITKNSNEELSHNYTQIKNQLISGKLILLSISEENNYGQIPLYFLGIEDNKYKVKFAIDSHQESYESATNTGTLINSYN